MEGAEVMNRVPDSRFLLVRAQASSQSLRRNLSEEFAKHGVSADRLFLVDNKQEKKSHFSYYNDIDISLDTFPLTGGTTTCEATWMGVPVVTLVGESFHQRISYGYLMHCGLEELCTFTPKVHTVQEGETVYRIARYYGVRPDTVVRANRVRDVTDVAVGQKLWIPYARKSPPSRPIPLEVSWSRAFPVT